MHSKPPITLTLLDEMERLSLINMLCPRENSHENEARIGHTFSHKNLCFSNMCRIMRSKRTLSIAGPCCELEAMFFPMLAYDEGTTLN